MEAQERLDLGEWDNNHRYRHPCHHQIRPRRRLGGRGVGRAGPGIIWTQGAETSCRYVYQYVSAHDPTGMWPGILDVDWDVTWEASSGESGFLEPLRTSIELALTVEEVQVTVTR